MQSTSTPINFYHKWAYVDEICQALNQDLNELSRDTGLPIDVLKTIRTLGFMDCLSISIYNSFCHPAHPVQIDIHKKRNWIHSQTDILDAWHEVFHQFIQSSMNDINTSEQIQPESGKSLKYKPLKFNSDELQNEKAIIFRQRNFWNRKHAAVIFPHKNSLSRWKSLQNKLINPSFITSVSEDQKLDSIKQKYAHIEPFFRGIHQTTEIAMNVMVDWIEKLHTDISQLTLSAQKNTLDQSEYPNIIKLRDQMQRIQTWWETAARHIMLLSKMDTGSYAEYRQALLGTSGGDSRQLRHLKNLMISLHFALPESLHDESILQNALGKKSADPVLNQLLSSIRETQAAASDFWLRHFTLTANTIGIIKGSQGLPVEKLLSFAVAPLMKKDSLVHAIGEVGNHYALHPEAVITKVNNNEKIMGNAIFAHVKNNLPVVGEYKTLYAVKNQLLDPVELRPLEPDDTQHSPYASWFDADVHTDGLRFGMHSFGTPLILFNESIANTANRLMEAQNDYWDTFFNERIPQFQEILFKVLNIPNNDFFTAIIDANATALLERLLSALPSDGRNTVLTTNQEFLTVNRALASGVAEKRFAVEKARIEFTNLDLAQTFRESLHKIGKDLKLVIFSPVMSNSQMSMTSEELTHILNSIPEDVPVIIDAVQCMFNVPISWGDILQKRANVYVIGSGIKHARSSSGLGFMIYPKTGGILQHPNKTGWCAYLSGMSSGRTTDEAGQLLYDDRWQWLGGTPGNVFAVELFINTWDAILRTGENIQSMHTYVQSLIDLLIQSTDKHKIEIIDNARRLHSPSFASNSFVLNIRGTQAEQLVASACKQKIYFDQREGRIRIGVGIQHGRKEIERLAAII